MRVVLDTNVLVAAFVARGQCHELVEHAARAPVCRDPDDDRVLATAVAARADCLVTGDADLLVLGGYAGIPIVRPADFWELEARRREG